MNTQEFEQAKREFADKWEMDLHRKKILLSDLNSLLEQHKEVILKEDASKKKKSKRNTDDAYGGLGSELESGHMNYDVYTSR